MDGLRYNALALIELRNCRGKFEKDCHNWPSMLKLCCAVVGEERVVIVDIGRQQLVGDLKKLITKNAKYDFPSDKLTLYLAKQNGNRNGTWLTTAHPDYAPLSRGDADAEATYLTTGATGTVLEQTCELQDYFDGNTPRSKVIHVLVKLPDDISTKIKVPVEGSPLLGREVARTTKTGEQSSNASFVGSSSWWPFSYLSMLLPKTASESKKNL